MAAVGFVWAVESALMLMSESTANLSEQGEKIVEAYVESGIKKKDNWIYLLCFVLYAMLYIATGHTASAKSHFRNNDLLSELIGDNCKTVFV